MSLKGPVVQKLKTSTDFVVKNVDDYNRVAALEQAYFVDMVKRVKVRCVEKKKLPCFGCSQER